MFCVIEIFGVKLITFSRPVSLSIGFILYSATKRASNGRSGLINTDNTMKKKNTLSSKD